VFQVWKIQKARSRNNLKICGPMIGLQSSWLIFGRIRLGAWASISTPILFVLHTCCYESMMKEASSSPLLVLYILQSCDHTLDNGMILKNIKMMFLDLFSV